VKEVITDEYFKQNLPRDSKYAVSRGTIQLVRGRRPVGGAINIAKTSVSLGGLASKARDGDRLLIEVKNVKRSRYSGGSQNIELKGVAGLVIVPLTAP
jgi:hypothetical protein